MNIFVQTACFSFFNQHVSELEVYVDQSQEWNDLDMMTFIDFPKSSFSALTHLSAHFPSHQFHKSFSQ